MPLIWQSPTDYVSGNPSLQIAYSRFERPPFGRTRFEPSTVVTPGQTGGFTWITIGLHLPQNCRIIAVLICYQLSSPNSYISHLQLTEMSTPDLATVIHDDTSGLRSLTPTVYSSVVGGRVPTPDRTVELRLQLNFQNLADEIRLGAVGIKYELLAGPLNLLDYGMHPGNTAAQNLAAFLAAKAAASGVIKRDLFLPSGTYPISFGAFDVGAVPITADLVLLGEGDQSILQVPQTNLTEASSLFRVAAGVDFKVRGVRMEGPLSIAGITIYDSSPNPGRVGRDGLDAPDCCAIYHEGALADDDHGVQLENVSMTRFGNCLVMARHALLSNGANTGVGTAVIDGCRLFSRKTPLSIIYRYGVGNVTYWMTEAEISAEKDKTGGGGNTSIGFIDAHRSHFGLDPDAFNGGADAVNNCVKIDRVIGYRFVDCDFYESNKYQFWQEGGSYYAPVSKMAVISGCRFHRQRTALNSVGIFASPSCGVLTVSNTRTECTIGISLGDCVHMLDGMQFFGFGGVGGGIENQDGSDGPVFCSNSYFGRGDAQGFYSPIRRENMQSVPKQPKNSLEFLWSFRSCHIADSVGPALSLDAGNFRFEDVVIDNSHNPAVHSRGGGSVAFKNCRNIGKQSWYFSTESGVSRVRMDGCEFSGSNGPDFDAAVGNAMYLEGDENDFNNGVMTEPGDQTNLFGNLQFKVGTSGKLVPLWQPDIQYSIGEVRRTVGGNVYECIIGGMAGSGDGPVATGPKTVSFEDNRQPINAVDIPDNQAHWRWMGHSRDAYRFYASILRASWLADFVLLDEPGTPTLKTINVQSFAVGGSANRTCGGTLEIYAVQDFAFGPGGNIFAAAGVRSAKSVTRLRHVVSLGMWVEV